MKALEDLVDGIPTRPKLQISSDQNASFHGQSMQQI